MDITKFTRPARKLLLMVRGNRFKELIKEL